MIKINMGCGKRYFGSHWVHIDGSVFPHVEYHDITDIPFNDNEVDLIYASHVLEYFDRDEVKGILTEWCRVLKPYGELRLAVPDFGACADLYVNQSVPLSKFVGMFYGKWKITEKKTVYHKTIYDFLSLKEVLEEARFKDVRKWDWREADHGHVDDYSQAYLPHMDKENGRLVSLNVECNK